jgi:hypothetical protein
MPVMPIATHRNIKLFCSAVQLDTPLSTTDHANPRLGSASQLQFQLQFQFRHTALSAAAVAVGFLLEAARLQLQFNSTRPTSRPTTPTPDLDLCIAVPSGLYGSPIEAAIAVPSELLSQSHRSPIGAVIAVSSAVPSGLSSGLYRDCDIGSPAPSGGIEFPSFSFSQQAGNQGKLRNDLNLRHSTGTQERPSHKFSCD